MNEQTKKPTSTPTQRENVVRKLRDVALEDLDGVSGGNAARCDMDSKAALD